MAAAEVCVCVCVCVFGIYVRCDGPVCINFHPLYSKPDSVGILLMTNCLTWLTCYPLTDPLTGEPKKEGREEKTTPSSGYKKTREERRLREGECRREMILGPNIVIILVMYVNDTSSLHDLILDVTGWLNSIANINQKTVKRKLLKAFADEMLSLHSRRCLINANRA